MFPLFRPKKLRFHPKQLYISAKQGELQKVLLMLGKKEYITILFSNSHSRDLVSLFIRTPLQHFYLYPYLSIYIKLLLYFFQPPTPPNS